MAKPKKLKAPFPAFGGKSRIAHIVWSHLGQVSNYVEPFFNSGAVLLLRPDPPMIETANDLDCYIANFWRATQQDPEAVVDYADGPVNEADLHSRHRYLVLSDDAASFRERMRRDPHYYDPKIAGWWCWGICCWIGSGWCVEPRTDGKFVEGHTANGDCEERRPEKSRHGIHATKPVVMGQDNRKPRIDGGQGQHGHGVHAAGDKRPDLSGRSERDIGSGVHANGPGEQMPRLTGGYDYGGLGMDAETGEPANQLPMLTGGDLPEIRPHISGPGQGTKYGHGVHAKGELHEKRPRAHRAAGSSDSPCNLPGVLAGDINDGSRPQLADTFSRGRGVNGNDQAETCALRRAWLLDWFGRLRDRLRTVRVCCGDWLRVCDSESVTTRLELTGIFFDPPYGADAGRNAKLYARDSLTVAADVRAYCLERGDNPQMRIVLAGYAGEGHEILEQHGWTVVHWQAAGGYGNRSEVGKANAKKERLWISPHCVREKRTLFDLESDDA